MKQIAQKTIIGLIGLAVMFIAGVTATADEAALIQRYRETWMEAERAAKTEPDRAALAEQLLEAARASAESDPALAVFICRRAYLFGSGQSASYRTAADALELMTEVDPTLRLESLEKVRDLYQQAYRENPSVNLGLGMKSAEATGLVARERRRQLDKQLADGQLDPHGVLVEANKVMREWEQARRTAAAVMNSAQSVHRQLIARRNANAELVATFLRENQSSLTHYESELMRAGRYKDAAVSLNKAQGDLDRNPDDATAKAELGRLYLMVFDAPARARPYAAAFLDGEEAVLLNIAATPEADLSAEQRLQLAAWYVQLSKSAASELSRRRGVGKARSLLARCDEAFAAEDAAFAEAERLAKAVDQELAALGVDAEPISLSPKPVAVVAVADRPNAEPRDPFADDELWGKTPEREKPTGDGEGSSGISVVDDPRAKQADPKADDPFAVDGDDGYWANREKSIFDFGRD